MGDISSKNRTQLVLALLAVFVLKCISNTQADEGKDFDNPLFLNDVDSGMDYLTDRRLSSKNLDKASEALTKLLLIPWPKGASPLVYVEKPGSAPDYFESDIESIDSLRPTGSKRSKYYRKYPWKRQQNNMRIAEFLENGNSNQIFVNDGSLTTVNYKRAKNFRKCPRKHHSKRYEPAYMCVPNKDDVYRLLVAIHGERDGSKGQLIDFCNRKRPASLVFTNIRYVG